MSSKAGARDERAYQRAKELLELAREQGSNGQPMHGVVLSIYEDESNAVSMRELIYKWYQRGHSERLFK